MPSPRTHRVLAMVMMRSAERSALFFCDTHFCSMYVFRQKVARSGKRVDR
ncbi:hypothetical protein XCR_0481 [Xanthomonas campestris pv. raphani 756C]|nr:hypothetical protein XCR_0481 [Xanthomonas campestris pv. raphani 756C]